MLTLEETRLTLKFFKVFSILNILPIQVDVESGKIQRQASTVKVFIWKLLFGVGVSHWLYIFWRLVQSSILEPEKYFRWDHFVLHFGMTFGYAVVYLFQFLLFVKTPEETVIIFNQLFVEREDPVQKMIDRQLPLMARSGNGNRNENTVRGISASGKGKKVKSGAPRQLFSTTKTTTEESNDEIETEVTENQPESESESEVYPRPLLTWPPHYSLDELLAKLLPSVAVPSASLCILILAVDPSRPQLLYSILPPEWQNVSSFLLLLAVESLCFAIVIFTGVFAIVTQILVFIKCQSEFKRKSLQLRNLEENFQTRSLKVRVAIGGREIEREIWILRQISKEMRELVLFIELFNRCFPFCIFSWKIFALGSCIIYYFFAIRHYDKFPFLSGFLGYGATIFTVVYTIMYANSSSIPEKMEEFKNEFLLSAQKTTRVSNADANMNKSLLANMTRDMKRIRGVGIEVGSFHQMERESTPNFIDFVLRNVVNLLVTFPH